jgi:hypothetical protein
VVNGILWSAKIKVPAAGAPVPIDAADLAANMDLKTPVTAKSKKAAK